MYLSSTSGQCTVSSIDPSDRNCLLPAVSFSESTVSTTNAIYTAYGRCVRGGL